MNYLQGFPSRWLKISLLSNAGSIATMARGWEQSSPFSGKCRVEKRWANSFQESQDF